MCLAIHSSWMQPCLLRVSLMITHLMKKAAADTKVNRPEDSYQVHGGIPNLNGFQFEYTVRDDINPFKQYYATSQDLCIAELEARIQWMLSNCLPTFGDASGFSSYNDPNSVIVYKAWKLPNDPTVFDPSPTL